MAKREPFTGNPYKYEVSELRDRHIGTCISGSATDSVAANKYKLKKATYTNEGVWQSFTKLKESFKGLFVDVSSNTKGFVHYDLANRCAQMMMDTFLFRRARGEEVKIPTAVVPVNAAPKDEKQAGGLVSAALFEGKGEANENQVVRWIFDNMDLEDVRPEDAPSAGAWSLLQAYRGDSEQKRDFYKTLWPKLLTKEDAEKGGKLQDSGKKTIELIDRLIEALPEDK